MATRNEELYKLIENLPEAAKKSAYDYLKYLSFAHKRPDWEEIMKMKPDEFDLSEEEERQLRKNSDFVSWEDAMSEFELSTDIRS